MVDKYTSSHVFARSTGATKTGPLRANVRPFHVLRRTVAVTRGWNFESSGWPPTLIKNPFIPSQFVRLFCASLQVGRCMELQVWRHPSSSGFFFQGHQLQEGLGAFDPIFAWLEHSEHRKSSSLAHGEETRSLDDKADIDALCGCRANDISIIVDSETISTQ